jgi:hypothetical protein
MQRREGRGGAVSLTAAGRARTSANLELSGLTASQAGAAPGFSARQLDEALSVSPAVSPARVWLLRDYLEQRVRAAGGSPAAYTVLTEQARLLAAGWFGVQAPPGA